MTHEASRFVVARNPMQPLTWAMDMVCGHLDRARMPYATLGAAGGFVNNINVAENLLLMCTWNGPEKTAKFLQRARVLFASWAVPSMDLESVWRRRAFELNDVEVRLMDLLRAALFRPSALVVAQDWFQSPNYVDTWWWEVQRQEFRLVPWYLMGEEPKDAPAGEAWTHLKLDTSGRLHDF